MSEEKKLDIIKYNKNLQRKMNISLQYYKTISGKYVIYGENGKGKEYNKYCKLIFEGEYLNGKRIGKGKEYYLGNLIFEGEYLYGKRNGEGKEYYGGRLIYEGKYANGKRNGKGKEYKDGRLIFEGEFLNGKMWNGFIKIYDFFYYLISEEEVINGKKAKN